MSTNAVNRMKRQWKPKNVSFSVENPESLKLQYGIGGASGVLKQKTPQEMHLQQQIHQQMQNWEKSHPQKLDDQKITLRSLMMSVFLFLEIPLLISTLQSMVCQLGDCLFALFFFVFRKATAEECNEEEGKKEGADRSAELLSTAALDEMSPIVVRWTDENLTIFEKMAKFVEERKKKYLGRPLQSVLLPPHIMPELPEVNSSMFLEENRKIHDLFYDIPSLHKEISKFNADIINLEKAQVGKSKQERFDAVYDPISLEYKEHPVIEAWRHRVLVDNTPCGNVFMHYDVGRLAFAYYASQTIPYDVLNAVALKYVNVYKCLDFYVDETCLPWPTASCGAFPANIISEDSSKMLWSAAKVEDTLSKGNLDIASFTKLYLCFVKYFGMLSKYRNSFLSQLRKYHELPETLCQKNSFVFVDKPEYMPCFQSFSKKRKTKQRFLHANMKTEHDMKYSHENHNGSEENPFQNSNPYLAFSMAKSTQASPEEDHGLFVAAEPAPGFFSRSGYVHPFVDGSETVDAEVDAEVETENDETLKSKYLPCPV